MVDDLPFECAPVAIVDQIALFLNEAREGLREAMAKDAVTLNAELSGEFNVSRPVLEDEDGDTLQNDTTTFGTLSSAIDAEEELLLASKESRLKELGHMQGGQQELIVVASLIDRIPNLAGLARTCEVFKTASLVVADASIIEDSQFQLIRLPFS